MSAAHNHEWESGKRFFGFLWDVIVNFATCLEQIFKHFKIYRFPLKVVIVCVRDLDGFEVGTVLKLCCWSWRSCCYSRTVVVPTNFGLLQLLQGCSLCKIVASLWREPSFIYWRGAKGAVGSLSLNSCHHVGGILLISVAWIAGSLSRELHFGIKSTLRTIPSLFPYFQVFAPG